MAKKIDYGKLFEEMFQSSSENQGLFNFRVRDVNRMALKPGFTTPKNKYDFILYNQPFLFPLELKSTKEKSFSFRGENPKIKQHQIDALTKDNKHNGVIGGFIFNFREPEERAFFVHIEDFNKYTRIAEQKNKGVYQGRLNEKSIPLHIVEQIGVEIRSIKKRTRYTYFIKETLDRLIDKYGGEDKNELQ
ncbi:penicillin-binding protein-related factor A (putative recombinase) [Virgibacillus halotolerans]|uniref:Holliday junction resolvase RecU n=1 Tax=Virgibacillus halotolerans TaxID=1071053 RepID=UPI0019611C78|nr:Holliday junction resolvase RecU [Virgibacillus halotolerans]MBM7598298.1 penicillin-binding protein-related factor A (putative recombinase) [Virgibacillus halotolerans]